jgi:hypothetical protein
MDRPKTLREALLSRISSYEEEVRSGRHVPPPLPPEVLRELELSCLKREQLCPEPQPED